MSLMKASIKDAFICWKKHLIKLVLYQLIFLGFYAVIIAITFGSILFGYTFPLTGLIPSLSSIFLSLISPLISILSIVTWFIFIPFTTVIFTIVLIAIVALIQSGGYPLLVREVAKKNSIDLINVLKQSSRKVHKIFALALIQVLPILIPMILIAVTAYFYFTSIFSIMAGIAGAQPLYLINFLIIPIAVIITIPLSVYVTTRLCLSLPILLVEDKGCIESLKISWNITKGKILSLTGTFLILGILSSLITWGLGLIDEVVPPGFIGTVLSYLFVSPLSGIISTIYYYNLKLSKKSKD